MDFSIVGLGKWICGRALSMVSLDDSDNNILLYHHISKIFTYARTVIPCWVMQPTSQRYLVFHPDPPHQLVGCGGWSLKPAAYDGLEVKEPIPNLRLFATHPNYLRCGIGLCIWDQIKRDMKHYRLQGRPISVFSSLPGESFYAKLGFRTIKRSDARIVADHYLPCILMRLEKENGLICESSNDRN